MSVAPTHLIESVSGVLHDTDICHYIQLIRFLKLSFVSAYLSSVISGVCANVDALYSYHALFAKLLFM